MARIIAITIMLVAISLGNADRECGYNNPVNGGLMINGHDAVLGQFPWQLSLEYYSTELQEWRHTCGASLISEEWVVTAAHCTGREDTVQYRIVLGQVNRQDRPTAQFIEVSYTDFIVHEEYENRYGQPNDIAVIHLPEMADLDNEYITPICLPQSIDSDYSDNLECEISGWGVVNGTDADVPDDLKFTWANVLTEVQCKHYFPWFSRMFQCTLNRRDDSGACYGDSGGPISCAVNGRFELVGAASFVASLSERIRVCDTRTPTYYANVPEYLDWIIQKTGVLPPVL